MLILREESPLPAEHRPDETQSRPVLVPLDGSDYAKAALVPAAYLAAALAAPGQGALHLTRVIKLAHHADEQAKKGKIDPDAQAALQGARLYLEEMAGHIRDNFVAPAIADLNLALSWSATVDHDVTQAIIRVAENGEGDEGAETFSGCDVIAMATHGYSGLHRWAMGSITGRVLHSTHLPLLIVRPADLSKSR